MNKKHKFIQSGSALAFIILMGIVSMFSDMTHEGARSILGAFLSITGASAATIGFVSGFGELCGYSLRLLFGFITDKTKRYWTLTIVGYAIQVIAIPALAFVPNNGWLLASILIIVERIGKAVKKPAKNSLVSFAASEIGQGKGFAYQEFLDQIGAFLGPVMLFLICKFKGIANLYNTYIVCFAMLAIPAVITILLLMLAKSKYPNPEQFEKDNSDEQHFVFNKQFIWYIVAISLFAFGFIDFTMITMHTAKGNLIPIDSLSLIYAVAMAVDAFSALIFGKLFDKHGLSVLIFSTLFSAPLTIFIFLLNSRWALFLGIFLWGISMGAQESIMKAAVSKIIPKSNRSSGFGIFETIFGVSWFLGSWLMGALYDISPLYMVIISVISQIVAIPFFYLSARKNTKKHLLS